MCSDSSIALFSRIGPCPDCGAFVALGAQGKKKRCGDCAKVRARERSRITAEKMRRARGIAPVKNTQIECADCGGLFTRHSFVEKRCEPCQYGHTLARANEVSHAKPRARKIGDKRFCKHCSGEYVVTATTNVYCADCRTLGKKMKLPHLIEKRQEYKKKYFSDPQKRRKAMNAQNEWKRRKVATDHVYCMKQRLRARLGMVLRARSLPKTGTTRQIIGCTWDELAAHIEGRFLDGMAWDNRHLWHIDHIVPLSSAKTEADVVRLSHYTNLQPLWAEDNLRKSNKMPQRV